VDAIIAVSDGVKYALVEGGVDAKLVHVIPDGIDFAPYEDKTSKDSLRQEFSFAPDNFLVGIMAQLSDDKGLKYLIQVSKQLKEYSPKIKIVILGEGPLTLELSEQVKEIQGEDVLFYLGFWEDLPQAFNSLDVFALSSDREDLGSIIRDAMAFRLPIVGTKVGEIPDWVSHQKTGLLVPPQRPKSLVKAILKIFEDKDLAYKLGQKGYEEVRQEFSAESMALKAIDLFEELAKKQGVKLLKNA
jgi:glycosyltransferase involved in cell wall biosynthesis